MRKLLYATTALAAGGLIASGAGDAAAQQPSPYREQLPPPPPTHVSKSAERIKLQLAGYYQQFAVITDQDYKTRLTPTSPASNRSTSFVDNKHNSEVCVIGETTLDNGLTIGVNVQIEEFTEADTIDESYIFVQSPTMGQLIVGDENNVAYLLHVTAPDGGINLDEGDLCNIRAFEVGFASQAAGTYGGINNAPNIGAPLQDTPLCNTNLRLTDNDSGKFTYVTPRFAGFQAGVSYIPNFEFGGDNNSALTGNATGDGSRNVGLHDGVAGGLNFTDQFGDFGVQASGGILWAQGFSGGANGDNPDLYAYNAGAQFSFAGFSVGGAWVWVPQGQRGVAPANGAGIPIGAPVKLNGLGWTVGGAYEVGPYKIGLTYQYGDNNKTSTGGKDRLEQAVLSGTYTLGPGIRLVGGVFYYDWQEENKMSENDGIGGLTGVKMSF